MTQDSKFIRKLEVFGNYIPYEYRVEYKQKLNEFITALSQGTICENETFNDLYAIGVEFSFASREHMAVLNKALTPSLHKEYTETTTDFCANMTEDEKKETFMHLANVSQSLTQGTMTANTLAEEIIKLVSLKDADAGKELRELLTHV